MRKRWALGMLMMLAWPLAATAGEPPPVAPPTTTTTTAPTPERPPAPGPKRAPDGVFGGTFDTPGGAVKVHLVIAAGVLVDGLALLPEGVALPLEASGFVDSSTLRAGGQLGRDYLRLAVEFFDADRGAGTFDGVVGRKRISGVWDVERR